MRSWCNPVSEDAVTADFSQPLFEAAITGYAEVAAGFREPAEWSAIPAATLTITVELAARFCADSLREQYLRGTLAVFLPLAPTIKPARATSFNSPKTCSTGCRR